MSTFASPFKNLGIAGDDHAKVAPVNVNTYAAEFKNQ